MWGDINDYKSIEQMNKESDSYFFWNDTLPSIFKGLGYIIAVIGIIVIIAITATAFSYAIFVH
jgi:hypothetical protein